MSDLREAAQRLYSAVEARLDSFFGLLWRDNEQSFHDADMSAPERELAEAALDVRTALATPPPVPGETRERLAQLLEPDDKLASAIHRWNMATPAAPLSTAQEYALAQHLLTFDADLLAHGVTFGSRAAALEVTGDMIGAALYGDRWQIPSTGAPPVLVEAAQRLNITIRALASRPAAPASEGGDNVRCLSCGWVHAAGGPCFTGRVPGAPDRG